eukprot:11844256-Alexandrium_andersonii.AAC.1
MCIRDSSRPDRPSLWRSGRLQLEHGRRFIQEQPHQSSLYEVMPWPSVLRDECVMSIVCDRC